MFLTKKIKNIFRFFGPQTKNKAWNTGRFDSSYKKTYTMDTGNNNPPNSRGVICTGRFKRGGVILYGIPRTYFVVHREKKKKNSTLINENNIHAFFIRMCSIK